MASAILGTIAGAVIGVGGSSVVAPMYIAEIKPARLRGRMVAVVQANIVTGMLLAYLSNYQAGRKTTSPSTGTGFLLSYGRIWFQLL